MSCSSAATPSARGCRSRCRRSTCASAAWHEPPHPEAVNAATYALRRSVNAYPDATPLREAIAERHGLERDQVAVGHGAGELVRAALSYVGGGNVAVAWPGWGPLPRLVHEAGAMAVPVALAADGAPDADALAASGAAAVLLCTPNDPTGAALAPQALHDLATRVPEAAWLIVDAALAEFEEPVDGALARLIGARERVVVVRSFSKAHGMAGFRAGWAATGDPALAERLAPVGGLSAAAVAAATWAVGAGVAPRRRALAAAERERMRAAGHEFAAGPAHLLWLPAPDGDGRALATHLAARRIYVDARGGVGRRPPRPDRAARPAGDRAADRSAQRPLTRNEPRMNGCTRQKYA